MAGEVFAYLAVPAYSVEKSKAGADWLAWPLRPRRASGAGDPGGRTGRASWASAPPPGRRRRPWPPRQTCCPAGSWAGWEAGARPEGGYPGGPRTASRGSDARKPGDDGRGSSDSRRPAPAGLQLNCKKSGSGYLIAPVKVFDAPFGREGGSGDAAPSSLSAVPNFSKL